MTIIAKIVILIFSALAFFLDSFGCYWVLDALNAKKWLKISFAIWASVVSFIGCVLIWKSY